MLTTISFLIILQLALYIYLSNKRYKLQDRPEEFVELVEPSPEVLQEPIIK